MIHFQTVLSLHIILLAFPDSSSEESPNKKENGIFTCSENKNPSFMVAIHCGLSVEFHGLILSDRWVLARGDELGHRCLGKLDKCAIGSGAEQVECKEIILHEKSGLKDYNLGLVSAKGVLPRWSGVLPWPEARGFTDNCTELVLYGHDADEIDDNCTTEKLVDCKETRNLDGKQISSGAVFCVKLSSVFFGETYNNSLAVCNNVVVGIATGTFSTIEAVAFTKIEAHYSFIREKTNLKVPFEASPVEPETEKPKSTVEARSSTRRYGEELTGQESTGRYGKELAELTTKGRTTQYEAERRRPKWEQRRYSDQHSRPSSGSSFKQSRVLLFLSVLVPLLLKLLCH